MSPRRDELRTAIEATIGSVTSMKPLHGGDVAEAYRVEPAGGPTVFAKTHRDPPADFFTTEASGLRWLRAAGAIAVHDVLAVSDVPPMLLEWIEEGGRREADEAAFGQALAALHTSRAPCFGPEDRRTTGSRRLPNEPCGTWAELYASQRCFRWPGWRPSRGRCRPSRCAPSRTWPGGSSSTAGPTRAARQTPRRSLGR